MAAGQGFKTFATGDVLSASDVNGYLMQGVLVFADATERNAEITSPQEGQFAYLKDTNVTTYYTGSAWANLDTTGMTNPMTTTGDTIYSSSGSTPARLGIGSTGQVLTVAGGVPSWATPAAGGGGKVLQVVYAATSTEKAVANDTWADSNLTATITPTSATSKVLVLVAQNGIYISATSSSSALQAKLLRGATDLITFATRASGDANAIQRFGETVSTCYLDTPATTSATTYKTQIRNYVNQSEVRVQVDNNVTSTIVLMEIGA